MALEDIVGKIVEGKDGSYGPRSEYKLDNLGEVYSTVNELKGLDTSSVEGQGKYKKLTGVDVSFLRVGEGEVLKKGVVNNLNSYLGAYVDRHYDKVLNDVDERVKLNMAFSLVPQTDAKSDEKYNKTRSTLRTAREKIDLIDKNPNEYLLQRAKEIGLPESMLGVLIESAEEILQIGKGHYIGVGSRAIQEYGVNDYLLATMKHLKSLESVGKELETKYNDELQKANPESEGALAKFRSENKSFGELSKIVPDLQLRGALVSSVTESAYRSYESKKKEAEKKDKD